MKTILVPIDLSAGSSGVLAPAIALAQGLKSRLVILHVVEPLPATDPDSGGRMSAEYTLFASELAASKLLALQRRLAKRSITVETRHVVGTPGHAIVDEAERHRAGLIVIGSHGHGGLYEFVVGSTTSRVLKHAKCPVVIVPMKTPRAKRRK
jgi:nucleotide-binding universal stress UspA family protein